jgi:hypothetical protein
MTCIKSCIEKEFSIGILYVADLGKPVSKDLVSEAVPDIGHGIDGIVMDVFQAQLSIGRFEIRFFQSTRAK